MKKILLLLFCTGLVYGCGVDNSAVTPTQSPSPYVSLKKELVGNGLKMEKARKITPADLEAMCLHLDMGRAENTIVDVFRYDTTFSAKDWAKVLIVAKKRVCPVYL